MNRSKLIGKIQTVLGTINPDELGITLPHEHCFVDLSTLLQLTDDKVSTKAMSQKPVCLETLWWIRCHWLENIDNLKLDNEELTVKEILRFKAEGGNSIVDVTSRGMRGNPEASLRISKATGINIIMGAGYYTVESPIGAILETKSEEELTEEIINDIFSGVDGVRSGIIGEVGADSSPLCNEELKLMQAAAEAQQATGASINMHCGRSIESYIQTLKSLDKFGADLSRVVLSHLDRHTYPLSSLAEIAKSGCYLEFDMFGKEGYYPRRYGVIEVPNDSERINRLIWLIEKGYLNQILISHDICMKMSLASFGGLGYDHILRNVVPLMRAKGLPEEVIHTIIVENPKRLLTFI